LSAGFGTKKIAAVVAYALWRRLTYLDGTTVEARGCANGIIVDCKTQSPASNPRCVTSKTAVTGA